MRATLVRDLRLLENDRLRALFIEQAMGVLEAKKSTMAMPAMATKTGVPRRKESSTRIEPPQRTGRCQASARSARACSAGEAP